jgi:hypothetical protein
MMLPHLSLSLSFSICNVRARNSASPYRFTAISEPPAAATRVAPSARQSSQAGSEAEPGWIVTTPSVGDGPAALQPFGVE